MTLEPARWFEQFDVTAALTHDVLAAATRYGADAADLFFEHSASTTVALSDGAVNRAHTSVDLGVGIRVVVGDQVGYAYTEDLSRASMLRAAGIAAQIARGGKYHAPVDARTTPTRNLYPLDQLWVDVDLSVRVPLVRRWEAMTFESDDRIQKVSVSMADTDTHVVIVTADGRTAADYRPMTRAFISCTAVDGSIRETGNFNLASRSGVDFYTAERQARLVQTAVTRATQALHAEAPPAGEMPVVMAAGSSGVLLHEAIGHGMEADFNRKGISIYADRMGKVIAPPEVTIVDDATLPSQRGSLNVDDEANPTEKTVLVQDGVLRSYLHDAISARHYGVQPTGNGRRESFRHAVLPRMRSTYMESGPHEPAEIIKSVKRGIYCESFQNGQVQIGAGDFAFYVRYGRLIEDGKLTRPVKDVNLIGNGPAAL
jgi:TldD protein